MEPREARATAWLLHPPPDTMRTYSTPAAQEDHREPIIALNYMAIALSVVLGMVLGFVWFSVLFDKAWARHMGMEDVPQADGAAMGKSMVIFFVSNVLIVYVLAHTLGVWRASAWGLSPDLSPVALALYTAGFTWLGFFLPLQMNRVAWEMKKWGLVAINAGFDLTRLLVFSFVLAHWV